MYCCPEPVLRWNGDPEAPSICCQKCGFVVAEYGELQDYPAESRPSQPSAPAANAQEGTAGGPAFFDQQLADESTEEVTPKTGISPVSTPLDAAEATQTSQRAPDSSSIPAAAAPTPPKPSRKRKKGPLFMRILQEPLLTDLIRAVGYKAWQYNDFHSLIEPLRERYSTEAVVDAIAELLISRRRVWTLKPDVREKATTLLGKSN
jgi:hypothetical protein